MTEETLAGAQSVVYPVPVYSYRRRFTREVPFGRITLGGHQPIRVESMTNTHTMDTAATVEQCRRLYEAGCEIIRLTVPTERDAENLRNIRDQLRRDGIDTPLVADIHFSVKAAMKAVEFVENIRINPGNYATGAKFSSEDYTDEQYQAELDKVREEFTPLVKKAMSLGVSMRIGTNHGSLSDRIVSRLGNSPEGMVEAALEFARISEDEGYYDILFSMKSSNVRVMIQAYRLLVARADAELRYAYPLHLGVTEAGDGDEGRIKSAMGIGSLLEDGLGDTIRVSLTEDPVNEVPVGFAIVKKYNDRLLVKGDQGHLSVKHVVEHEMRKQGHELLPFEPFGYSRRPSCSIDGAGNPVGADALPGVETMAKTPVSDPDALTQEILDRLAPDKPDDAIRSEYVGIAIGSIEDVPPLERVLDSLGELRQKVVVSTADTALVESLLPLCGRVRLDIVEGEALSTGFIDSLHDNEAAIEFCFIHENASENVPAEVLVRLASKLKAKGMQRVMLSILSREPLFAVRKLALELKKAEIDYPLVVRYRRREGERSGVMIESAIQTGTLFCDGIGDILALDTKLSVTDEVALGFNILQAARIRMSKTEFISCPGCGRTYFELEKTTALIKQRVSHLKGLKIGIMGCIVNGPGEMADADFGYVGSGKGRISLYVGKECVEENLPEDVALERLIELIRQNGKWVDPV
ncbi:1-hydroxy-2-methyl-2-(E)-butenyl 4-diphosphate synthase [Chlorobaculum parvum NCIB 8327]|uniref:4-hydroxy-3-methylbut-2-en-1-yl diphosphate synthase (flavodoxin) n=1 Tax=Chlorobaculum parvum (strain DSM 263 / NCIMB 8327) TaxID=517417 RepID=B3QQT0_CHLP8|nr:(E)-4-hydroxy-3-methylbut-2-enyl-diphosphate synthase [Chlorobaculum parvum]ACF12283.1 1-hydroxy-2-methyl-2-(E)-butenyl 4-diphosphate synthase [Chlorobaculum parvum NCIB 8327]